MAASSEKPWWLQLHGEPRWMSRRDRERWPDWDQLTLAEKRSRRLQRHNELIIGQPWRTWVLALAAVLELVLCVVSITAGRPFGALSYGVMAVVFSLLAARLRRIRRAGLRARR